MTAPPRRSRAAQLEETRARLLAAASRIIAAGGVADATIRGVCQQAGFSQGAFYTSFASKDDLLLALLEQNMRGAMDRVGALLDESWDSGFNDSIARIALALSELGDDPVTARLSVELHLHARRDPGFATAHQHLLARYHAGFAGLLQRLAERHDRRLAGDALDLSRMLHALWLGFVIDNRRGSAPFRDALQMMFRASLRQADAAE